MEFTLTTPALLFPAISLLLLAYTNRFLTVAGVIRNLSDKHALKPSADVVWEIKDLKFRVLLIRYMQAIGGLSFFCCVLTMFLVFWGYPDYGKYVFGVSLLLLMLSLMISVWEVQISSRALHMHIRGIERDVEA